MADGYERFARWERDRTWPRLLDQIQALDDSVGAVEWTVAVGSAVNRSHQHAAGAHKMVLKAVAESSG